MALRPATRQQGQLPPLEAPAAVGHPVALIPGPLLPLTRVAVSGSLVRCCSH